MQQIPQDIKNNSLNVTEEVPKAPEIPDYVKKAILLGTITFLSTIVTGLSEKVKDL